MTRKFTQLITHWDADEAYSVISFLDELRDLLWVTYGEEIIERHQSTSEKNLSEGDRFDLEFDDDIF